MVQLVQNIIRLKLMKCLNNTSMNSECNITINVDKINSEQDIKKLAYQIGDIITERNKRDWKKVR